MSIFTEDIKNTRFILTVLALGLLGFFGLAIIILLIMGPSYPNGYPEGLMSLLTTLLGAIIAIVSVAYNSHFKAREEADRAVIPTPATEEAAAEVPAAKRTTIETPAAESTI